MAVKTARPRGGKATRGKRVHAMSESNQRSAGDGAGSSPTGENLEKVRDILFGAQMRDADRRFARLEEKSAKDLGELREEIRKRLDSLEAFIKKEVQSALDRLKVEQTQRSEADRGLADELKAMGKAATKRADELEEQQGTSGREIREELLEQSKTLRDEIVRGQQDLAGLLQRAVEELRAEKADRAALAGLFNELALRLSDQEPAEARK